MPSFLDTSAILNGALERTLEPIISPLVLTELENLKHSLVPEVAYKARRAIKEIMNEVKTINIPVFNQRKVEKLLKSFNFLTDINDHKLLCEAELFARENNIELSFVTCDVALYMFSLQMPHLIGEYFEDKVEEEDYFGWKDYTPDDN